MHLADSEAGLITARHVSLFRSLMTGGKIQGYLLDIPGDGRDISCPYG
mgnify:CR=1 FL=1